MAIYYIDPHTTTNGTGTWASPWSLSSSTRTGLTNGDEIRIKGVALTSLLTATSYTATVTNNYQLTITAGGGLGADWVLGDIGYLPAYDTFFRVYSVTGNIVQVYTSTSMLPVLDWSATSVTLRKVDTTTYGASTAATSGRIGDTTTYNNITVSDCWTSETTRVTDGTVKTLIQSSGTTTFALYINNNTPLGSGWTVNLQNTHVVCCRATSTGYCELILNLTESTVNINQVHSWGTGGQGVYFSSITPSPLNTTVTIKTLTNYNGVGGTLLFRGGSGNTLNVTNTQIYGVSYMFGSVNPSYSGGQNTINFTNIFYGTGGVGTPASILYLPENCNLTVTISGVVDFYPNVSPSRLTYNYSSPATVTVGSGFAIYANKRASSITSLSYGHYCLGVLTQTTSIPTITNNSSVTFTQPFFLQTATTTLLNCNTSILPQQYIWDMPFPSAYLEPYSATASANQLITYRDGSAPKEYLGIYPSSQPASNQASLFPQVTTDASVYKTTGPSINSNLNTRLTSYWLSKSRGVKVIKVPCTSGTSYTITGYIRCDDTAYVNGDCSVHMYLRDTEVDSQNMTTACINAWEQFTLTFTATETAEYQFAWKMYYANGAKSYWLDDLTIA